jgi:hypothetical protein
MGANAHIEKSFKSVTGQEMHVRTSELTDRKQRLPAVPSYQPTASRGAPISVRSLKGTQGREACPVQGFLFGEHGFGEFPPSCATWSLMKLQIFMKPDARWSVQVLTVARVVVLAVCHRQPVTSGRKGRIGESAKASNCVEAKRLSPQRRGRTSATKGSSRPFSHRIRAKRPTGLRGGRR